MNPITRRTSGYECNVRDEYIENYGLDLENRYDKLYKYKTPCRLFCMDCKKYHTQGRNRKKRLVRVKNGCRGEDLQWATCIYKSIALEVIKNENR